MRGTVADRDFVVTGMGAVCAVAHDCAHLERAIAQGIGGIAPITRFDTDPFDFDLAAEVKEWPGAETASDTELCLGFARRAADEALAQARVNPGTTPADRIGLVFGTNLGDLDRPVHALAIDLAATLGVRGPCLTVCTACSSSTGAVGLARDLLAMGSADVVLAGGSDVLTAKVFAGFHALGVLAPDECAPFSTPFGTTLGEGAGFVVLERPSTAAARGVRPIVALTGFGLSGDGHHETSPDPRGFGVARALSAAVLDAGIEGERVGYVNAHGSGTEANDASEWRGIQRAFGGHSATLPVSSAKGALGHAQGAAGVLEAIVTIVAMRRGLIPASLNFKAARHYAPADPVPGPSPRPGVYDHAVCFNSAFGGANAALVLSRVGAAEVRGRRRAPVVVRGLGAVGPGGTSLGGVGVWPDAGMSRVPPFSLGDIDRRVDPRGLDPSARFLTAAAALALADGGVAPAASARANIGLVAGALRPSPKSLAEFARSIDTRGLGAVSAPAFARIVLNAAAGSCSKALGLKGPLTVLTIGSGTGLAAILLAVEMLGTRDDCSMLIGGAADELAADESGDDAPMVEGAACVLLSRVDAEGDSGFPKIGGYAMAGPKELSGAVSEALRNACLSTVDEVFDETDFCRIPGAVRFGAELAFPSALAFVEAASAIRCGRISSALVTSGSGDAMSLAVVLTH